MQLEAKEQELLAFTSGGEPTGQSTVEKGGEWIWKGKWRRPSTKDVSAFWSHWEVMTTFLSKDNIIDYVLG